MPAEIGRGAAGFTNVITRSGKSGFHGSVFEFLRNSSLDARNYFDHATPADPGRIPPFRRNEFGFTNGGPVILPHLYDGSGRTFYFGQYQGFRQVLGTTQVLPVPSVAARSGFDTTAFAGDTLTVPIDPAIAAILARYPLPNDPAGPYGLSTYAASSKVTTNANQFSLRLDQDLPNKAHLFARFNFNNLFGPTTNPDQTAIDRSFGVVYVDHQRNFVLTYAQTLSPRFDFETSFSVTRTTPQFPTPNHTDPAVKFTDGLFEAFNSAGGSVMSAYGNLFLLRQNLTWTASRHLVKAGGEIRVNRDTTYFGISINNEYDFGDGKVYSPVAIASQSGTHDIPPGGLLPDTLSAFLTGSAFIYTTALASPFTSGGIHIGPAAISRNGFALYAQDTFKITPRITLDYGLRFEVYSPITERAHRTSGFLPEAAGQPEQYVVDPQPGYRYLQWNGLAPRVQIDWRVPHILGDNLHIHAGGGLTTIPPNIWQDNFLTGAVPYVIYPHVTATAAAPIQYGFQITTAELPTVYSTSGQNVYASGKTNTVAPNTVLDIERYQRDLAALSPGANFTPLNLAAIDRRFGNAYLQTWTLGAEKQFAKLTADASYVGTASAKLPRIFSPNGYSGAGPAFAPFTQFDSSGNAVGGFGTEQLIEASAHSSYHSLQASLSGPLPHGGPGIQLSYTWAKAIDDTSGVSAGTGATGATSYTLPQDPFDNHPEKGPAGFDVTHGFTMSLAQDLQLEKVETLRAIPRRFTAGWELLSISTISSGLPFTVYSGVQQTAAGSGGVDRPNQIGQPHLSTAGGATRAREDYFGLGANNGSYFSIPDGSFGTVGRNTFRGPAFYDFDFSLIKDTPVGARASGGELFDVQFRSEFFNLFNIVDFGLPANTLTGSGFGEISKTAGSSRQIQFSLKLLF
jgi:hypothetical protein